VTQVEPKLEKVIQELDATKKLYDLYYHSDAKVKTLIVRGNQPPPKT